MQAVLLIMKSLLECVRVNRVVRCSVCMTDVPHKLGGCRASERIASCIRMQNGECDTLHGRVPRADFWTLALNVSRLQTWSGGDKIFVRDANAALLASNSVPSASPIENSMQRRYLIDLRRTRFSATSSECDLRTAVESEDVGGAPGPYGRWVLVLG